MSWAVDSRGDRLIDIRDTNSAVNTEQTEAICSDQANMCAFLRIL